MTRGDTGLFLRQPGKDAPTVRETLVAVFESQRTALQALHELAEAGFPESQLGLAVRTGRPATASATFTAGAGPPPPRDSHASAAPRQPDVPLTTHLVPGLGFVMSAGLLRGVGSAVESDARTGAGSRHAAGERDAVPGGAGGETARLSRVLQNLAAGADDARRAEDEFRVGHAIVVVRPGDRAGSAIHVLRQHGARLNLPAAPPPHGP